ncbi:36772_t:CDS:1, partial [Gigaspora margarita]
YSNDNGMKNLINKYKKLMQIANWQWGNNFYGGEYMFLLQRMPPAIMKHISSMNPKPANRNEFFTAADNQFLAVRLTMSLTGNLKEKVSHFKERKITKFNNVQTTEKNNTFTCHFRKQPGHYKRSCPKLKGQQNFNRVIVSYTKDPLNPRKTIPVYMNKYCIKCGKEKLWHTRNCPKNRNATYYMGKRQRPGEPIPMVIGNTRNNRFPKGNNYKRNSNQRGNYRKGNNNNYRINSNNNNRRRYNN